jgi:hypothetical protein
VVYVAVTRARRAPRPRRTMRRTCPGPGGRSGHREPGSAAMRRPIDDCRMRTSRRDSPGSAEPHHHDRALRAWGCGHWSRLRPRSCTGNWCTLACPPAPDARRRRCSTSAAAAHAPARPCKRYLALLDRMFPPPSVHPRLPLIVRVVTDSVAEHGYAEVRGVPGDQQTELRRRIRALVRKETGHSCQTLVHESMVVVVCEPIADLPGHTAFQQCRSRCVRTMPAADGDSSRLRCTESGA